MDGAGFGLYRRDQPCSLEARQVRRMPIAGARRERVYRGWGVIGALDARKGFDEDGFPVGACAIMLERLPDTFRRAAQEGRDARREEKLTRRRQSGEARGALWSEFDLDARTWTIPAF